MTPKFNPLILGVWLLCVCPLPSSGAEIKISVDNAWARATVPAQSVSGAFFEITSSHSARLIKAETDVAETVELHRMSMKDGVMRMRQLKDLALTAGTKTALAPGGDHLMLINLKKQLKAGETFILQLTVQDANYKNHTVRVNTKIK